MSEPKLLPESYGILRCGAEEFTEEFSDELGQMSGRCIDIGTGPGDNAVQFILPKLKQNSTLLCSDISETMYNIAKEAYGIDKRLSFMVLDIETPNLPKDLVGQFDHLTSLYCLHWCHDLRRAFENIYALLKPGGTSFVTFVASFPAFDAYSILLAMPKYAPYIKKNRRPTPPFQQVDRPRQSLVDLLNDVGFEVQTCSLRQMYYIFESVNELRDTFLGGSPFHATRIPDDLKSEYTRDMVREFTNRGITFNHKHVNNEDEYKTLFKFRSFVVHLKKPLSK